MALEMSRIARDHLAHCFPSSVLWDLGVPWSCLKAYVAEQRRVSGFLHSPGTLSTRGALLLFSVFVYPSWHCFLLKKETKCN